MANPSLPYTPFHDPAVVLSTFWKKALPLVVPPGATRLMVTLREMPFREAVTTAVLFDATEPATASKDVEDCPPPMLTEDGTVR